MEILELNSVEKNCHKYCALFLSEFSFMIICIIIASIGVIFPSYYKTTEYTSYEGPSWNSSSDPILFTHLSDIHVSNFKAINQYRALFRTIKKLGVNFHLFTGDLVDNYEKETFPKVGKQNLKDWKNYKELIETELYNETILDVAGNHDLFGVLSPFDYDCGYLNISKIFTRNNTKTLKDFWFKTINIKGMNFILLNPYKFPMARPPYVYYSHPSKEFLDLLEKEINKIGPCSILSHYPTDFFWSKENSNDHDFDELMKNENIQYIFTGHTHPGEFKILHHEYGGLEFIGISIKKTNDFGFVTIDNGRLVYNRVEFKENNFRKYFMTCPVPIEQLTKSDNFNEKNIEIRVISYKNKIEDNLYITGDFNGKLEYQRELKNGAKLYSMPLRIKKDGEYEIKFNAPDYEIIRKFYVGKKITIKGEKKNFFNYFLIPFIISFALILLCLLVITFPIRIIDYSFIDDWLFGKIPGKWNYYIICIFLSPLILNYRICSSIPLYFRIILFFFVIYPLVLPFHFIESIKGNIGYSFLCFYFINNKILYDEWSIFFIAFYFWLIISPISITVSGFKFKQSCFYIFHFILLYLFFIAICFVNFRFAGETVKFLLLFFHPCFVVIPIILNILIYIILCKYNKTKQQNEIGNIFDKEDNIVNINSGIINSITDNQ